MTILRSRNPVFPDTNVLVAYVIGQDDPTRVVCLAFDKAKENDVILVTNQVMAELYSAGMSEKKIPTKEITRALRRLGPQLVYVSAPSPEDLKSVYIEDPDDMSILYSARAAGAKVILTRDNKWFLDNVYGIDGEIMDPHGYLYHDEILAGKKTFSKPYFGRIKRVFSDLRRGGKDE